MTLADRAPEAIPPATNVRRPAPPRAALPLVGLPVLVMLCVCGYRVGHRQLWEDEYSTWHAAVMTLPQLRYLTSHLDFVVLPYYLFMHYWIHAFGGSPGSLRAPSVVAMSLAAGVVALIGRRLFGTGTGLIAGLLFAAVPGVCRYAQEARPYGFAVFFTCLATLLLLSALDRPTWPRWLLYALAMIAVGGSHIVSLTVLSAHALVVLRLALLAAHRAGWHRPWRAIGRLWWFMAAVALIVAVIFPIARTANQQSFAVAWIKVTGESVRAFPKQLFGSQVIAEVIVALAALAAVLLLLPRRDHRPGAAPLPLAAPTGDPPTGDALTGDALTGDALTGDVLARDVLAGGAPAGDGYALTMLASWAVVPVGLLLAAVPALHLQLFFYRYLLFIVPAWVLLAARGLDGLAGLAARRWARLVAVAVALAAIGYLSVPDQQPFRQRVLPGSPDYSGVAAAIAAQLRPRDGIAYAGWNYKGRRALTYEMRNWRVRPRDVFLVKGFAKVGQFVAQECQVPAPCLHDTARIWLVNTAIRPGDFAELPPATAQVLRTRFTVSQRRRFARARLLLLTLNPAWAPKAGLGTGKGHHA
ncbi:hypothetical protein GCM10023322_46430 [Rugosimonospora acidiphila]|uniref:Glycosyltransferase RgtA/B/C/D-like domain-containing protein n=1 Tax=Rugosimonospora acidiphila TaxID=556531 RepID=A0ABP9S5C7_9ACTN